MHITELNVRNQAGVARAEARVVWEEADRAPLSLFVDVESQFHDALRADPNAFLVACVLPAWHAGERRVKVAGRLCPVLCDNLRVAFSTLKSWYPDEFGAAPTIEASQGFGAAFPRLKEAVSALSCGIDSLATLRLNKLHLPPDHPASIKGAILIAQDSHPECSDAKLYQRIDGRLAAANQVCADAHVIPIPVRTNAWWLSGDGYFYDEKWHGALLGAIASFLSRRFHKAYIASGRTVGPWGSHPLLDPYYSSAHFQIEHTGRHMSRLEKTALVADWPAALQNIRVCQNYDDGEPNCGTCGKCIETMLALVALDKLRGCTSFPTNDVSQELLGTVQEYNMIRSDYQVTYYKELLPILKKRGRDDLIAAISQIVNAYASSTRSG